MTKAQGRRVGFSRFACSSPAHGNLGVVLRAILCTKPLQLGQEQSRRPFLAFRAMNVRIVETCGEPLRSVDALLQKGFKPVAEQVLVASRWGETHIAFTHPDVSQFITRSIGESRTGPDAHSCSGMFASFTTFLNFATSVLK